MDTDWRDWKSPYDDGRDKTVPVSAAEALPGRDEPLPALEPHAVRGVASIPPFPAGMHTLVVGMGCFWGAERVFWRAEGVYTTAVGYAGGFTRNPSYEQVCSARTGHAEVVLVVFDPVRLTLDGVLRLFWENHDPTQSMRQGDDVGTQYRSMILYADARQRAAAERSRAAYQRALTAAGLGPVRTEIAPLREFFYAEPFHQQILAREPDGYCGVGGTGVSCPVGTGVGSGRSAPGGAAEQGAEQPDDRAE